MKYTDIIIRPLLSEKVSKLSEAKNKQYVFQVAKKSNKVQIKPTAKFVEFGLSPYW